jgi:hypothetical protein
MAVSERSRSPPRGGILLFVEIIHVGFGSSLCENADDYVSTGDQYD